MKNKAKRDGLRFETRGEMVAAGARMQNALGDKTVARPTKGLNDT